MITQTIDLCMIPGSTNPVIHVNQYDAYPGGLIFNLYEESAFEIPAGAAVTINGTKPDGYGFSYTASYSGNVVTADLTQQMTAVAGNVECELRVTKGDEIIGTQNFTLAVEEAALNDDTVISDSDIPAIVNAERYATEAAASAEDAADSADDAAEAAQAAQEAVTNLRWNPNLQWGLETNESGGLDTYPNATLRRGGGSGTRNLTLAYNPATGTEYRELHEIMSKDGEFIPEKLDKSGGTMTGELRAHTLRVQNSSIYLDDSNFPTTVPQENRWHSGYLQWKDSANATIAYFTSMFRSDDFRGIEIGCERIINGSGYYNNFNLGIDGSGNKKVVLNASVWRDALQLTGIQYRYGAQFYDSTTGGAVYILSATEGQTSQTQYGFTGDARIACRTRTRADTSSAWGGFSSWQYLDTWGSVTPTAGTDVSNIGSSMARYNSFTKMCCLNINIRVNATSLATSTTLLSGLPKPVAAVQGLIGMSNNDNIRVKVTTTGYLQTDGAHTLTATGQYFNGSITYPYSSLT